MSVGTKLLQAAAGNAGETVYVDDVFSTFLYTGNSTNDRPITNGIDLSGEGGLVWIKMRESNVKHRLHDTERGVNSALCSNNTDAAETGELTSFNNNGFSLTNAANVNTSATYASWTFRKQAGFFDVVTYTGDGTTSRQIAHNLGSSPGMMLFKKTNGTGDWKVFHRSLSGGGLNGRLRLDSNGAEVSLTNNFFVSSTHFGSDYYNASGDEWVVYLFAHNVQDFGEDSDEAIIYCDSFTTTSTWGNFKEEIGFEPQWLMVKRTDSTDNWIMLDMMRGVTGPGDQALVDTGMFGQDSDDQELKANTNDAESTQGRGGFYSKGYLGNLGGYGNATYIYVAIRRPNKPASEFAATDLFGIDTLGSTGDGAEPGFRSTFPCDTGIRLDTSAASTEISSRLIQGKWSYTDQTSTEGTANFAQFDYQNGWGASTSTASNYYGYMFRRAKGFFDVVAYAGTGSDRTQTHNLGVAPELILIKRRGPSGADWVWYVGPLGAGNYMYGDAGAKLSSTTVWNNTSPTESVFSLGAISSSYYRTNGSGSTYIAYLFATVAGISKIGSYTGTGSDLNVDCGFSAGAKFVLIKRTDGTENTSVGNWYVYDSARGIVAGNDPYKLLNSSAAQVTNTDYIDPLSSGFTVTSSASAELNASGGNYIFLAIA